MATVDINAYKKEILMDIIGSPEIVGGIESRALGVVPGEPDSLIYKNVFPFLRIPDAQCIADAYVLFAVDVLDINRHNRMFLDLKLTFWAMAHQDVMKMDGVAATRIDFLGEELRKLFDGSSKYGYGVLELAASREVILNDKFQYRELIFRTVDMKMSAERKVGRI